MVGLGGQGPSRCMRGGVERGLVEGKLVVRAVGKSRAHKAGDERRRLLEEVAESAGLEGLGKRGRRGAGVRRNVDVRWEMSTKGLIPTRMSIRGNINARPCTVWAKQDFFLRQKWSDVAHAQ